MADPLIRLAPDDAAAPWATSLQEAAERARQRIARRLGLDFEGVVTVRTYPTLAALQEAIGSRPTHVLAVARPETLEILIVGRQWRATGTGEQFRTLVHEMTHLAIGRRVAGELPAWLNEGLAMVASGESGAADRVRLAAAGSFGTLISLAELQYTVLFGGERQRLAYAESLSVTRFLIARDYGGDPRGLVAALVDPRGGAALLRRLSDPLFRDALDLQWRAQFQTVWNWIAFLSGASVLWTFAALLLTVAWWRKRRINRLAMERFESGGYDDAPPPPRQGWYLAHDDDELEDEDDSRWE